MSIVYARARDYYIHFILRSHYMWVHGEAELFVEQLYILIRILPA